MSNSRRIAVIGGGITGLAAAHAVVSDGAQVVLFETRSTVGGVIRTTPFAGHPAIDEGADAFLARVPWAVDLARAVSLGDTLTSPAAGRAAVWWNGLHDIPEGLLLGLPTDVFALARSPLLSPRGKLRAATEVLRPRSNSDVDSIGSYVRSRFGDEVHERLVDPLVGSIYAADTDDFSLAAIPQLAELAAHSRSVLLARRRSSAPPSGPVFYAPAAGMGALVEAIAATVIAAGGELRCDRTIGELAADGERWRVDGEQFDGVVLACPARAAAALLLGFEASIASTLAAIPTAGVALLTLALPAEPWPARLRGLSGYLVPKPQQRLVTAVSFGSQKWAHWASPDHVVLRVSLGRDGLPALHLSDGDLLAAARAELETHLGVKSDPTAVRVSRWPDSFPQYRPHHGAAIAATERLLPRGIALAGASYHGIGIPACIRSAQQAARVLMHL
ncbi:MAG TPA: protoporphyrinogen oxidase [Ilumatobacteraceae bacterium]|nr:protoporphyrinogen oxidase [Ilumatobacteraceae bacterium]